MRAIREGLQKLYGDEASRMIEEISNMFSCSPTGEAAYSEELSINHKTVALCCYADSLTAEEGTPLQTLTTFFDEFELSSLFPLTHLLPFFPWDTDRGFSVKDYRAVDPAVGNWNDIASLSKRTDLMFDLVLNHASVDNPLVQKGLIAAHLESTHPLCAEFSPYKDFVITFAQEEAPSPEQLKLLSRPRANPVLTPYTVIERDNGALVALLGEYDGAGKQLGNGLVWTTFSRGKDKDGREQTRQVDLNFKNPEVFLEALRILRYYKEKKAKFIRLDAVGYLWKNLGSSCLHEQETLLIMELIRKCLQLDSDPLVTVAEVNEPQKNVFHYLGHSGGWRSDLVYQFTHFPLAVYTLMTKDARLYREWLTSTKVANGRQFVTLLGTHDGMGMKPVRDILSEEEIIALGNYIKENRGALANMAKLPGGREIIYELCSTPWELLNGNSEEIFELQLNRYLLVLSTGLFVRGLPLLYINGLFGAKNYTPKEGLDENRTVNRERHDFTELKTKLTKDSSEQAIFQAVKTRIALRQSLSALDPKGPPLEVFDLNNSAVLSAVAKSSDGKQSVLSLCNFSNTKQTVQLPEGLLDFTDKKDLISGKTLTSEVSLQPYQVIWTLR